MKPPTNSTLEERKKKKIMDREILLTKIRELRPELFAKCTDELIIQLALFDLYDNLL